MGLSILAVALVPRALFARMLDDLRARYPGARLTALIGSEELRDDSSGTAPDEYLLWRSFGTRALIGELRRRRPDLLVVAYGRDYYTKATYWKALALALASGARGKLFCPDAELGKQSAPRGNLSALLGSSGAVASAVGRGIAKLLAPPLISLYVGAAGLLLIPVLVAIALADLVASLAGVGARPGRSRIRPR